MKKPTRKSSKRARKVGRPRKSLKQLKVSGGYDRNPGRLRKRMGVEPEPEREPGFGKSSPESIAIWDYLATTHEMGLKGHRAPIPNLFDWLEEQQRRGKHLDADPIAILERRT